MSDSSTPLLGTRRAAPRDAAATAGGPAGGPGPAHPDAGVLLKEARALTEPVLRAAVETLPPRMRLIAGYQLGWWDAAGVSGGTGGTGGTGGKLIRPALTVAVATALGAPPGVAAAGAAAVELAHNSTLVHDDIMDRDTTRRHRATTWAVFGIPDAMMAGDAMLLLAQRTAAGTGGARGHQAAARLAQAVIEVCEGQHHDTAFERLDSVSTAQYAAMAEAKTGALLGCAAALGALAAGARPRVVDALDRFGRDLGLAFQVTDDVLGIWGDPAVTGKAASSDLAARKKSAPVAYALALGGPAGARLAGYYRGRADLTPEDLAVMAGLLAELGARDWAEQAAAAHTRTALQHLRRALAGGDPQPVRSLVELLTRRDT